jgi:hypothetical protein
VARDERRPPHQVRRVDRRAAEPQVRIVIAPDFFES